MAGPHLKGGSWGVNSKGKRFQVSKGLLSQVKGNPQTEDELQSAIQDVREKNNKAESKQMKQRTTDRVEKAQSEKQTLTREEQEKLLLELSKRTKKLQQSVKKLPKLSKKTQETITNNQKVREKSVPDLIILNQMNQSQLKKAIPKGSIISITSPDQNVASGSFKVIGYEKRSPFPGKPQYDKDEVIVEDLKHGGSSSLNQVLYNYQGFSFKATISKPKQESKSKSRGKLIQSAKKDATTAFEWLLSENEFFRARFTSMTPKEQKRTRADMISRFVAQNVGRKY